MKNCKDCTHYNVCVFKYSDNNPEFDSLKCSDYVTDEYIKDLMEFIKLFLSLETSMYFYLVVPNIPEWLEFYELDNRFLLDLINYDKNDHEFIVVKYRVTWDTIPLLIRWRGTKSFMDELNANRKAKELNKVKE